MDVIENFIIEVGKFSSDPMNLFFFFIVSANSRESKRGMHRGFIVLHPTFWVEPVPDRRKKMWVFI